MSNLGAFESRPLCVAADLVAHTPSPSGRWHSLASHSRDVGDLAGEFGATFGAAEVCRLAGYVHDAGKAVDQVQTALRAAAIDQRRRLGVPHKVEGAQLAAALFGASRLPLASCLALVSLGHHRGIPSWTSESSVRSMVTGAIAHTDELSKLKELMSGLVGFDLDDIARECALPVRVWQPGAPSVDRRQLDMFTRMCHSTLVDADSLDTARHFGDHARPWQGRTYGMSRLRDTFMANYHRRYASDDDSEINRFRRLVFHSCVDAGAARREAGIYRLPAPTGTGKTMASAAFALTHAARFGKRRVIVAVPFTTITTQNAQEYREMFGELEDAVLEHHSEIIDDDIADDTWRRLSAPQWDGEFIVTTTVQLFESLMGNRPSRTRKLHRIVDSVIVLDEVQALPIELLGPILDVLRELVQHYGVTVLLASATQPSFWKLPVWQSLPAHDVLPVEQSPEVTQRVRFEVRGEQQSWDDIARELAELSQALTIVNTRRDADQLFELIRSQVSDPGVVYLLSRSMTSDHRHRVLDDVQVRLRAGQPTHVVSTQLVEAGVNLDFPVVFRAHGPADSVVQAAGRCNRNGHMGVRGGRVVVFDPEGGGSPPGRYRDMTTTMRSYFVQRGERFRFDDPSSLGAYYADLYLRTTHIETTRQRFEQLFKQLDFQHIADEFRMIPEDHSLEVVVVEHPDSTKRRQLHDAVDRLRCNPLVSIDRETRRLLSKHTATVTRSEALTVETLPQGVQVWLGAYDPRRGAYSDGGLTW